MAKKLMTKHILSALIFALCMVGMSTPTFAQTSRQVRKERMKALRKCKTKKSQTPVIRLNFKKLLTVEEFLNYPEKLQISVHDKKEIDSVLLAQGVLPWDTDMDVKTQHYEDSVAQNGRLLAIRDYRHNELTCFFGREEPLILFGNQEISRKAFEELPEDTVAFVNFYLTDFVRDYYAPRGRHGVVYVCPRKIRSQLMYTRDLPLPASGRNYIEHFGVEWGGIPTTEGGWFSMFPYINEKLKEYQDEIDKGIHATVATSCIIHTDGTVEPFFVERIDTNSELTREQMEKLTKIAADVLRSLPPMMSGGGLLYNRRTHEYIWDSREVSRSIPISFHKD